jgi:hypothetical protein
VNEGDDDEQEKANIAYRLGVPLSLIDHISFTVFYSAIGMFVRPMDLMRLMVISYYGERELPPAIAAFADAWKATGYADIIFGDAGTLFEGFGNTGQRLRELEAVPRLKAAGFDNASLVDLIRNGRTFTGIATALDEGIPVEYALAV